MSVSGLSVEILVNGREAGPELRRITVAFERAGDEIADFGKHVFSKLGPVFEAEEARQFDAEGGGPSGGWAALSPAYAAWKEKRYPGKPILEASGALRAALTQSSSPFAERSYSGDTFEFGTHGVPYATAHQFGTAALVARPPIDLSSDFERDLQDVTLEAVRESVKESGLAEFVEGP